MLVSNGYICVRYLMLSKQHHSHKLYLNLYFMYEVFYIQFKQLSEKLKSAEKSIWYIFDIFNIPCRSEILELKQSTVAEIRSYQNPPPVVHTVMTATFLILGHKEKETKVFLICILYFLSYY